MAATSLGIIAGSGTLPGRIARACRDGGRDVFIVAFTGETAPEACEDTPHVWLRIGEVGKLLRSLKGAGCKDVVLAGPIQRPALSQIKPDLRAIKLITKIQSVKHKGDDALLSLVVQELEDEGFNVVGAGDVMADLAAPTGTLGAVEPDAEARRDIEIGVRTARALGALDVGQAAVVQGGVVLGVEAIEGTDALMARCAELRQDGPGGVLVKVKKPAQERRADLPTIGVDTVERAAEAGLRGIAVEAGESLILDRPAVVARADEKGLFLVGIADT
jgi:DUF1009 family protein